MQRFVIIPNAREYYHDGRSIRRRTSKNDMSKKTRRRLRKLRGSILRLGKGVV